MVEVLICHCPISNLHVCMSAQHQSNWLVNHAQFGKTPETDQGGWQIKSKKGPQQMMKQETY